ncbi:MAG: adenylosuccinate synthetase [Pseudomonadota bacterium]
MHGSPGAAHAVVGAGYGDEGKGLVTDYLCQQVYPGPTVVVRFNGGAQAGHTVTRTDGVRHVFSHFGSGALRGVASYLSRFFVCHPLLFRDEYEALRSLGATAPVFVDPEAMVTTPYDVMINQALEAARADGRHGSCGLGFGETIQREDQGDVRLRVADLADLPRLRRRLGRIRDEYLPARLQTLDLAPLPAQWLSDVLLERFVADAKAFAKHVEVRPLDQVARGRHVIFEGAQGLLLDMDYGIFPHVTRSHTGLRNVAALADEVGLANLEVAYVTRAYATRHGNGPLAHELSGVPFAGVDDPTNAPNPWQGSQRFAWLDSDQLRAAVQADLAHVRESRVRTTLFVTCLDQADAQIPVVTNGRVARHAPLALPKLLAAAAGLDRAQGVWGPSAAHVGAREPAGAARVA